ncbi:MAG: glutamine amidotransferase [Phycisphaeraceae bacterium]|nr:MAG: glutamine amidotransferase [Phycisphaeraceae bacterium]
MIPSFFASGVPEYPAIDASLPSVPMILLLDNYDSFTWNLVQRLGEIDRTLEPGRDLVVVRNDAITPGEVDALDGGQGPSHVIVSPGPCTPNESGVCRDVIDHVAGRVPVLGVCLGHQCIADRGGMTVARHPVIMHGKTSELAHDNRGVFAGLSNPFTATRYHSLVVTRDTIPTTPDANGDGWEISATCRDPEMKTPHPGPLPDGEREESEVVMGLRRVWADAAKAPLEGVQFHPESFLTVEGPVLLWNFLRMGERGRDVARPAVEPLRE